MYRYKNGLKLKYEQMHSEQFFVNIDNNVIQQT